MNSDFSAATPDDLSNGIDGALLNGRFVKKVAIERLQMAHLLKSLAHSTLIEYPFAVTHTTEYIPDFQLSSGKRRIAVELTRIKFQDLEHARALQASQIKSTLSVSALYPKPGGPRKKLAVIKDGFGMPAMLFPFSPEEQEKAWLTQASESLIAKTVVIKRGNFVHGDEDWLVLLDPVGELPDIESRGGGFSRLLKNFWGSGWFSRIFVQDIFFRWQIAFTVDESQILSLENTVPPKEILEQTFQIDSALFAEE
jgi:hypothetical protein